MVRGGLRLALLALVGAWAPAAVKGFVPAPFPCSSSASAAVARLRLSSTSVAAGENRLENQAISGPLTPVGSQIIVRVREKTGVSAGGVVMMEKDQDRPTEGEVVALGPGRKHLESGRDIPMPCAVGDKVLYGEYRGTACKYNGKDHQFVRDEDIMFVYSGDTVTPESVKMIGDQILVKADDKENMTSGGLLLAPTGEDGGSMIPKPTTGTVVAVGSGHMTAKGDILPMPVKTGDRIKFQRFAGENVQMSGQAYKVVRSNDILLKW
jgi:chaperonin GroES